jgi:hypothetical protein
MTKIPKQQPGVLNIHNIQGNDREHALKMTLPATDMHPSQPLDLTKMRAIVMSIKDKVSVLARPIFRWTVGNGLQIIGEDNDTLFFSLDGDFWEHQKTLLYFDIVFVFPDGSAKTLVKGTINQDLTVGRP